MRRLNPMRFGWVVVLGCAGGILATQTSETLAGETEGLTLRWADNLLTIHGSRLPGGPVTVWYLEAYCRPGSTNRNWRETVIGHQTELVSASDDHKRLHLRCTLKDGVVVDHRIAAGKDEIDFRLTAHNPTDQVSEAHWAQPCMRVDKFTGRGQKDYLSKCFVFVNGKATRLPFEPWATKARYTPGQVWRPRGVDRNDVNPRPLSTVVPSNGLTGCYSGDEKTILAVAWEPYQELFQGVIVCMHSDFRIGGLKPGETKRIRGKIYLTDSSMADLKRRYEKDFPEHVEK